MMASIWGCVELALLRHPLGDADAVGDVVGEEAVVGVDLPAAVVALPGGRLDRPQGLGGDERLTDVGALSERWEKRSSAR